MGGNDWSHRLTRCVPGRPLTWSLAPEPAIVPSGIVMRHQSKLGREHPPLTHEGQVAAFHFRQSNVLPLGDLDPVFGQPRSESPLALGRPARCLSDVDQLAPEVEGVDTAFSRSHALDEGKSRALP